MTTFVPIADGAQVHIGFQFAGLPLENRLWFVSRQPPIDITTLTALATGVADWHSSQVMPLLSHELTLSTVEAVDWTSTPAPLGVLLIPGVAGGSADESHSANVADRIWFLSAFDEGRIRNSHFVPGIPKDQVDLNLVNSTFRSDLRDAYINLIDLAPGFGAFPAWRWVCASAWLDGSLRAEQRVLRTDFIVYKRPYVAQRRKRLLP